MEDREYFNDLMDPNSIVSKINDENYEREQDDKMHDKTGTWWNVNGKDYHWTDLKLFNPTGRIGMCPECGECADVAQGCNCGFNGTIRKPLMV